MCLCNLVVIKSWLCIFSSPHCTPFSLSNFRSPRNRECVKKCLAERALAHRTRSIAKSPTREASSLGPTSNLFASGYKIEPACHSTAQPSYQGLNPSKLARQCHGKAHSVHIHQRFTARCRRSYIQLSPTTKVHVTPPPFWV